MHKIIPFFFSGPHSERKIARSLLRTPRNVSSPTRNVGQRRVTGKSIDRRFGNNAEPDTDVTKSIGFGSMRFKRSGSVRFGYRFDHTRSVAESLHRMRGIGESAVGWWKYRGSGMFFHIKKLIDSNWVFLVFVLSTLTKRRHGWEILSRIQWKIATSSK